MNNNNNKYVMILILFIIIFVFLSKTPLNERNWNDDQKILAYGEIDKEIISIYNIRNFSYENKTKYTINYYNKSFNTNNIISLDYIVEPFSSWDALSHTFLSFGFTNGEYISISVEIRKEIKEEYSPIKGLFKEYELMYVIADERDVVKLRSNYRNDTVYIFPINTTTENMKILFTAMVQRANELRENPEFYNTLTNTCTTNIVDHIDKLFPQKKINSFIPKILPGYSKEFIYNKGLIKTNLSYENSLEYFKINKLALKHENSSDFSIKIRKYLN